MYLNTQKIITTDEIHKWMEEPEKITYDIEYISNEYITNKNRNSLYNYISFCMKEEIYDEAIKYLTYLKNDMVTGVELGIIQLTLAKAYTKINEYIKADIIYNNFLLDNETYYELDLILYKAAKNLLKLHESTILKQITSIISNSYTRDISYTEKTLWYLEKLVEVSKNKKYLDYAIKNINIITTTITKHDLHIARYYYNTHKHEAALNRLLKIEARSKNILTEEILDLKKKILINLNVQHTTASKMLLCRNYNFLKTINTPKNKID
jgi:outer membrane protein assembly factor BamD (BamD/ComL family)